MTLVHDALGRVLDLAQPPQRIVSLVPSLTEWLFVLGLDARIVGVTDFCLHPVELVAPKTKVRGTKNPQRTTILSLQPDLVVANREENRQRDVDALAAAGVPVYVTDITTVANAIEQLETLAHVVGAAAAAQPLLDDMRAVHASQPTLQERPRVLALIWRDPWMAIGNDTYSGDLVHCCGAYNAGVELAARYPRFELHTLRALRLDRILLLTEPYAFSHIDIPLLQEHFDGPVDIVDGELLTWYGPRIGQALRTVGTLVRG